LKPKNLIQAGHLSLKNGKICAKGLSMKPNLSLEINSKKIYGNSMNPLIKHGCQLVIQTQIKPLHPGDIVVLRTAKRFLAHRVIEIKKQGFTHAYLLKGDNNHRADGWFRSNQIVGRVEKIVYPNYSIDLNSPKNQFVKKFFVVYSRLNQRFLVLLNLRKIYKFPFSRFFYRLLLKS